MSKDDTTFSGIEIIGLLCLVAIMFYFLYLMDKSSRTENLRKAYIQISIENSIKEMNCVHTGYGPYKSRDKVYVCDSGTYIRTHDRLSKVE